jgi:uncharacterized oxidoreductase
MQISGNTILITGGGSGIGRALAHRWHDLGNHVIVAGRRREILEETIRGRERMSAAEVDMQDPDSILAFARRVIAENPELNILVNNAGVMRFEDLTSQRDLHDAEETIITNLLGPIRMADAFVDHLKTRPGAAIINVSSGLAFVPLKRAPTYSATKAAIHSYTVALRAQLNGLVDVIEIVPPGVQTDLTPGQAVRDGYMPLEAFANEVFSLLQRQPTPPEICVERVRPLRLAESEGHFEAIFAALSAH